MATTTILQGGRAKAYRPLPVADRRAALEAGLSAYANGHFFEAHEILEPAWMGSADIAERELTQGLIKLAAAYVHATRGNPDGIRKNLVGARKRLAAGAGFGPEAAVDVDELLAAVDDRLAALDRGDVAAAVVPPVIRRSRR
jgi:predicted metal-dependent hydrolase